MAQHVPAPSTSPPTTLSPARYPMFDSLRYRDFRWMLAGSFISFMAIMMHMITQGWLVLRLADDSPLALALVMASFSVPSTFMGLIGGALADRISRKRMIVIGQSGNAALTLLIGILDFTGVVTFWHVLVIGFANGSMMALNMPSRQAIISDIVPEDHLMNAISLSNSSMNLTRIAGPALAGFLILFIGTSGVFFLVAGTFILGAASMAMVNTNSTPTRTSSVGLAGDIKAGFTYAFSDSAMLGVIVLMMLSVLFGHSYNTLMPAWAREALDIQSDGLGMLMLIMGVGALVGTLGLAGIQKVSHRGLVLLGSCMIWGIGLAAFSQVTDYWITMPFLMLIGSVSSVVMSLTMTVILSVASPEMRGRMMAITMMSFGAMPLSSLPFGALAEAWGSTADALFVSGVLLVAVTLVLTAGYPAIRRLN
ncbi:MFS transporter [Dehalococcoidia bacterium]|nr:MFS transporter [Dehalococcoidia bacterium]